MFCSEYACVNIKNAVCGPNVTRIDYAYYNLGCVYLTKNDYNNARKSFESAIKINPKEPDYYYNLGYTYKKLNNIKRANKAIALYNELIKQRTEN